MRKLLILVSLVFSIPFLTIAQATKKPAVLTQCVEKESKPNKNGDVTITKICTYQNYRSIAIGKPDYKGRTFWSSKLYLKNNGQFVKMSNAAFFNDKGNELLAILNKRFNEGFIKDKAAATDPDSRACFGDQKSLEPYQWDAITVELKDDSMVFTISYGLGDACYAIDEGSTSLTFKNLKPYLKP